MPAAVRTYHDGLPLYRFVAQNDSWQTYLIDGTGGTREVTAKGSIDQFEEAYSMGRKSLPPHSSQERLANEFKKLSLMGVIKAAFQRQDGRVSDCPALCYGSGPSDNMEASTLLDPMDIDSPESESASGTKMAEAAVLGSIRRVLSQDPKFAEEVTLAVLALPENEHSILFAGDDRAKKCGDPAESGNQAEASDGDGNKPSIQGGTTTTNSSSSTEKGKNITGSTSKSKKRKASWSGQRGQEEDDEPDRNKDSRPAAKKQAKPKPTQQWLCPFSRAFPLMIYPVKFTGCKPPSSLTTRSAWRKHLETVHGPLSIGAGADLPYYMSYEQLRNVTKIIDDAVDGRRPRDSEESFKSHLDCFTAVWRVIFPAERFPDLKEPTSPFYAYEAASSGPVQKSRVMFEVLHHTKARRAVGEGLVATVDDFRLSPSENLDMLAQAWAIAADLSPSLLSSNVIQSTSDALRTAVAKWSDVATQQPTFSEETESGCVAQHNSETRGRHGYDQNSVMEPEVKPDQSKIPRTEEHGKAIPISLPFEVTEVSLVVSRDTRQAPNSSSQIRVVIPPNANLESINQKRASLAHPNPFPPAASFDFGGVDFPWPDSPQQTFIPQNPDTAPSAATANPFDPSVTEHPLELVQSSDQDVIYDEWLVNYSE